MKEKIVEWWTAGRIKTILPNLDREQENRFLGTPAYCTIEFVFSANRVLIIANYWYMQARHALHCRIVGCHSMANWVWF